MTLQAWCCCVVGCFALKINALRILSELASCLFDSKLLSNEDKFRDLQEMKAHEDLMNEDKLVEFENDMGRALFVSHEWICPWKPDPELAQFRHLQGALRKIIASKTAIDHDPLSDFILHPGPSVLVEHFTGSPLFIWYDYFSIPQVSAFEWSLSDLKKPIDQALDSIAAYIARCHLFVVLCPMVENPDRTELFGLSTWASRGWCRLEKTIRELLPRKSFVVIKSEHHFYAVSEVGAAVTLAGPPGEGAFGVGEDKRKLSQVLLCALKEIILYHLSMKHFEAYRTYLNLQSFHLRGFSNVAEFFCPIPTDSLTGNLDTSLTAVFLQQNGFYDIKEVDKCGWSPLCYAALRGDPRIVRSLLADGANPNDQTRRSHKFVGAAARLPVIYLCAFFGHTECVQALVSARADFAAGISPAICGAACGNHAHCVRILCEAGDTPHRSGFGLSSIANAAAFNCVDAGKELLAQSNQSLNLSHALHFAMWHTGGSAELVGLLVDARADVNQQLRLPWNSLFGMAFALQSIKHRLGARRIATRFAHHSFNATPLILAIISGQFEGAAALIVAKARVDVPNSRGTTALDLARELCVPQFLRDALGGNSSDCRRMVSSATTNRFLVSCTF